MFFWSWYIRAAGEFDKLTVVEIRSCQDVGFEETKTHASLISCWEPALKFRCCFMMSKRPFWFSGRRTRSTKNYSKASITSETMVCFKKFNSVIATYPCFVLGLGKKKGLHSNVDNGGNGQFKCVIHYTSHVIYNWKNLFHRSFHTSGLALGFYTNQKVSTTAYYNLASK